MIGNPTSDMSNYKRINMFMHRHRVTTMGYDKGVCKGLVINYRGGGRGVLVEMKS